MKKIVSILISLSFILAAFSLSASAESKALPYTAEQLLHKDISEIVSLMGGNYNVSCEDYVHINAAYPISAYIYNDKVFPGLHFQVKGDKELDMNYRVFSSNTNTYSLKTAGVNIVKNGIKNGTYRLTGIHIVGSGKLNSKISANMRYNDLTNALGKEFNVSSYNYGDFGFNYNTTAYFASFDFPSTSYSTGFPHDIDSGTLKSDNPKLDIIMITPNQSFKNPSKKYVGDIDYDGKFTSADSLNILRASVKLDILTDEQSKLADVNGDGKIDSSDSLSVLRYSVKIKDKNNTGNAFKAEI